MHIFFGQNLSYATGALSLPQLTDFGLTNRLGHFRCKLLNHHVRHKILWYSLQVREILAEYDAHFCPMSLDEAYLDLTEHLEKRKTMTESERTFYQVIIHNCLL